MTCLGSTITSDRDPSEHTTILLDQSSPTVAAATVHAVRLKPWGDLLVRNPDLETRPSPTVIASRLSPAVA